MSNYYNTLEILGDAAFDQRQYTLAAKKYTEANNRIKVNDPNDLFHSQKKQLKFNLLNLGNESFDEIR